MLLSIIIPTFNRSRVAEASVLRYIKEFESIASLTDFAYELILVDDGSSVEHNEFLLNSIYLKDKVKILTLTSNSGPGIARDAGLQIATAQWVWFLDDDDTLNANKVSALLELLKESKDTEIIAHSLIGSYVSDSSKNKGLNG